MNEIIIGYGTYDRCIFGLKFNNNKNKLFQIFGTDAHEGCVKVVNSCNNGGIWMASGGTDETVHVYNAVKSIDYGQLYGHEGSINTLEFYNDTHLLSGSEDGSIRVWQIQKNWLETAVLKSTNHSGVRDLSIHKSGKVALSVHNDSTLKMWNLIKGRLSLSTNLKKSGHIVQWSPSGDHYGIVSDSFNRQVYFSCTLLTIFSAAGESIASLEHEQKILCFKFLNEDYVICGCENGNMYIWEIKTKKCVMKLVGHSIRVRSLDLIDSNMNKQNEWSDIISASSNGEIAYWKIEKSQLIPDKEVIIEPTILHRTPHRITGLCIIRPQLNSSTTLKRKLDTIKDTNNNNNSSDNKNNNSDNNNNNAKKKRKKKNVNNTNTVQNNNEKKKKKIQNNNNNNNVSSIKEKKKRKNKK